MASPQAVSSDSEEDFHSLNGRESSSPQLESGTGQLQPKSPAPANAIAGDGQLSQTSPEQQDIQPDSVEALPKEQDGITLRPKTEPVPKSQNTSTVPQQDAQEDEALTPPAHPLKSMQGPFEESILESSLEHQRPASRANAELRRQRLLDAQRFDESWTTRWKQRPEAQFHPLLKLMAQIVFGMHLLQQNQAKSDQEVVKILQSHVDEVDNFLEQTAEDFDLAIRDIDERIRFLQLPMQHMKVFDIMLDDKQFRTQLLDGNDKIERIIDRTARAMNASLLDVQKGRQATRELSRYLNSVQTSWPSEKAELEAIFNAMRGNEEGWRKCYKSLQTKGNHLGNKLIELGTILGEMSRMAAAASRRTTTSGTNATVSNAPPVPSSTALRSRFSIDAKAPPGHDTPPRDKPLPRAPIAATPVDASRPMSFHQRFERPRGQVPIPPKSNVNNERPRTSHGTRTEKDKAFSNRAEDRSSGALSSHPPELARPRSAGNERANGGVRSSSAQRASILKTSNSDLKGSHTRAASATAAQGRQRESSLFSKKGEDGSFMRRFSLRKKPLESTKTDAATKAGAEDDRQSGAVKQPASPTKQRRLDPVAEQPDRTAEAEEAKKLAGPPPPLPEDDSALLTPEPKSLRGSFRLGRSSARQSMASSTRIDTSRTRSEAPSMASSFKRRSMSLKNIFQRKGKAEPEKQ